MGKPNSTGSNRHTPEHTAWINMRERCHNRNRPDWIHYGGRGIRVCEEWRWAGGVSFDSFLAHVGRRPSPKHSIDRIDNSRGYEPGNVRWATKSEQRRNYRQNHWIEAHGERLLLTDWAKRLGCKPATILMRIKRGWDPALAVTKPVRAMKTPIRRKSLRD